MKSLLMMSVAIGALVTASGIAIAAPFNWAGAYAGVSVGVVRLSNEETGTVTYSRSQDGMLAVLDAGYNIQSGQFVFGIEGDIGTSSASGTALNSEDFNSTMAMGWNGSLRARAGVATDTALFYLTGGLAAADLTEYVPDDDFMHKGVRTGGTVGFGAEFALADKLSLKTEVRYTIFANHTDPVDGGYTSAENSSIALVGLNYHF